MVMYMSSCCGFFFTTPSRETPASSCTEASMAAIGSLSRAVARPDEEVGDGHRCRAPMLGQHAFESSN